MNTKIKKFEVAIPNLSGTAIVERVSVEVPLRFDERIKEWMLTEEAHQIIDDTKARHMGLILPTEMKELRERLGFSQIQMGKLFQIGEKSWSRWESGKHRPTRSISLFIKAVYDGKIPTDYLLGNATGGQSIESAKRKHRSNSGKGVASASRVVGEPLKKADPVATTKR